MILNQGNSFTNENNNKEEENINKTRNKRFLSIFQKSQILNTNKIIKRIEINNEILKNKKKSFTTRKEEKRHNYTKSSFIEFSENIIEDSSNLLKKGLKTYEKSIRLLEKIEDKVYKPNKIEKFGFKSDRYEKEIPILTVQNQEPELIIELKNKKNEYEIQNFGFLYFFIKIKNQETPLKLNVIRKNGNLKDSKIKLFLSTKFKHPNKFNCEIESDNHSINYYPKETSQKFNEECLYFAFFSENNIIVRFFYSFGRSKSVNSKEGFGNFMRVTENEEKRKVKTRKLHQRMSIIEKLEETRIESIKEQIRLILRKRREKMRELANGKNCINYNIENLKKNDPKEMTFFRIQKRQIFINHFEEIKQNKINNDILKHSKALFSANRSEINRRKREYQREININYHRLSLFWKQWIILFQFTSLIFKIKTLIKSLQRKRYLNAHYKLMRKRYIKKFMQKLKNIAKDPISRLFLDSYYGLNISLSCQLNTSTTKCELIIFETIKICYNALFIKDKFEKYLERVKNIQRKWRNLDIKKTLFKDNIKKLWNDKILDIYLELLNEKNNLIERSSSQNSKKIRGRSSVFSFLDSTDSYLQNMIINNFMENLSKNWIINLNQYRESQKSLQKDEKKQKQISILRKFFKVDSPKLKKENIKFEEKEIYFQAPILYKLPDLIQLKQMIKIYLEKKKII